MFKRINSEWVCYVFMPKSSNRLWWMMVQSYIRPWTGSGDIGIYWLPTVRIRLLCPKNGTQTISNTICGSDPWDFPPYRWVKSSLRVWSHGQKRCMLKWDSSFVLFIRPSTLSNFWVEHLFTRNFTLSSFHDQNNKNN